MREPRLNKAILLAPALVMAMGCEEKIHPTHVENGFFMGERDAVCTASPSVDLSILEEDIRVTYRSGETIRHQRLVELRNLVQGCRSDLASGIIVFAGALAAPTQGDGADYTVFNAQMAIGYRVGACAARPYVSTPILDRIQAGKELGRDVSALEKLQGEMSACERPTE